MVLSKDELAREEILKQAQYLFKQFGLKKTTMDDIATACGKAKSTLYHYFKNKEEVFDRVVFMELEDLRKIVRERVDDKILLKDKFNTYIFEFYKEINNKVNIYRIIKHELIKESLAQVYFNNIVEFEKSYITKILNEGLNKNELTGIEPKKIPFFAEVMLAAFFGVVRYSLERDGVIDLERLQNVSDVLLPRILI